MSWRLASHLAWWLTRSGVVVLSALVAAVLWGGARLGAADWLVDVQERVSDAVWRLGAERREERRVILVDIDEKSLAQVGAWPWSRATQARLLDRLAAAGAGLQVLDLVFTDSRGNEPVLAQALRTHKPVLAQLFALEGSSAPMTGQLIGALDWPTCPAPFPRSTGHLANVPDLAAPLLAESQAHATAHGAASGVLSGHITPRMGRDGVVRHQPAVICAMGQSFPALGLAALMRGTQEEGVVLQRGTGWWDPPWLLVGKSQTLPPVPLDAQGDVRIPWGRHPDSFISLSAADVLGNRIPPGLLQNAWVLIGSSAFGLNDSIATPFSGVSAGMQAHAQLLTGLIDGRVPYTPRAAAWYQALAAAAGFALLAWVARGRRHLPVYLLPLVAAAWAALLLGLHVAGQLGASLWLGWLDAALYVLAAGVCLGVLEHARSRLDRDRLYTHLSSYLPAPVAAALALQPPSSAIRASTRLVSVMFADIRNFSAYCEARPPEEAAAVLHAFFAMATRVVESHGGMIESFQGDAVIAVWNGGDHPTAAGAQAATHHTTKDRDGMNPSTHTPPGEPSPRHPHQALAAAIELQRQACGVLPDPAPAGLEPLALGVGVETGPAMAGSFGLASRRTHMVMGRTVTIASRLVGMTADLAHPILVGEGLAGQVGGVGLHSMGTFLLDGLRAPHHVYAPPLDEPAPLAA